jgi:hypothetical protein
LRVANLPPCFGGFHGYQISKNARFLRSYKDSVALPPINAIGECH